MLHQMAVRAFRAEHQPNGRARVQVRKFKQPITLEKLKSLRDEHKELKDLQLFSTTRLSVQNVTLEQWECILSHEDKSDG
jgi:predicted RNA-binding protein with PUA-like domain